MMLDEKFSIVLPLKILCHHAHNELQRFSQILLPTLEKYLVSESIHDFIIIHKSAERKAIEHELARHRTSLPIRLVSENSILNPQVIQKTKGWYIQQLIKLGIARQIKTQSYLVLDSDCFLTKPFAYKNLFSQNKIIMNANSWKVHTSWWTDSAKILRVPMENIRNTPLMGATPQILITRYVCQLLDTLDSKHHGSRWDQYLCARKFTEYTLYWLFLIKTESTHNYQTQQTPVLLGNGLWRSTFLKTLPLAFHFFPKRLKQIKINGFVEQHIDETFRYNEKYFFSLVQSNIEQIPVECVARCIKKYI